MPKLSLLLTLSVLRRLLIPVAAILLAACEPVNPPPAGYVDACYGGKDYLIEGAVPEVEISLASRTVMRL